MNPNPPIERQAIRTFISNQRGLLEEAQANGTLARTKLDIMDAAENSFKNIPDDKVTKFRAIFNEELEAFCSDMRFASVTIQQQVERGPSIINVMSKFVEKFLFVVLICLVVFLGIAFSIALSK